METIKLASKKKFSHKFCRVFFSDLFVNPLYQPFRSICSCSFVEEHDGVPPERAGAHEEGEADPALVLRRLHGGRVLGGDAQGAHEGELAPEEGPPGREGEEGEGVEEAKRGQVMMVSRIIVMII